MTQKQQTEEKQPLGRRPISFYALAATAIAVGFLFFQFVRPFLLPVLLAAILAILFRPLYNYVVDWLGGHRYFAAALMTVAILLLCLLPVGGALVLAGQQLFDAGQQLLQEDWQQQPILAHTLKYVDKYVPVKDSEEWRRSSLTAVQGLTKEVYNRTQGILSNVVGFVVGLSVVALGLFYFLAEGPNWLRWFHRMSPLRDEDEAALIEEFDRVCRGVVVATVACALAQAVLAGIGFAVLGVGSVWLLAGLTMFASLIPFLGSAAVWLCVVVWLISKGEYASAVGLAVYGTLVISGSDNFIRAYVIHGTVKLHPFVAFISVLGALQMVGLWGIFIGPIVAAVFYALLKIVHSRLNRPETTS